MQRSRLRHWAIGLAFFASSCFFLSITVGDPSWIPFVAGAANFAFGCLLFNQSYRIVIEPREDELDTESWEPRP